MTEQEHLMVAAMEECDEVSQRLSKALRFGMDEVQPGQDKSNRQRILDEYTDLVAVMEMNGFISLHRPAIDAKRSKIKKYMEYSISMGITSR